jgi:hypothetical protein
VCHRQVDPGLVARDQFRIGDYLGGEQPVWLTVLTARHHRHVRQCVDGEPVYRRLPDGRLRFSWDVATRWADVERGTGSAGGDVIR